MTGEQLTRHMKSQPFAPFRMHLADGRVLPVDHPEFVLYIPGARTCVVADADALVYDTVRLPLATLRETGIGNGRRAGANVDRPVEQVLEPPSNSLLKKP